MSEADKFNKVHCLFEQSGTFKNEFIKLGLEAFDYDIQNEFNQTDYVIDLFQEIDKSYNNKKSIFDNICNDDLVMAFFPCTRFESQIQLYFSGNAIGQKKWNDERKIKYAMKLHDELHLFYKRFAQLMLICIKRKIPLIVENPCNQPHYLTKYFPIKCSIIDNDRTLRGDYYKKPTQYWFINCNPKQNMILEAYTMQNKKTIINKKNKKDRSMISQEYANRFIREFIL